MCMQPAGESTGLAEKEVQAGVNACCPRKGPAQLGVCVRFLQAVAWHWCCHVVSYVVHVCGMHVNNCRAERCPGVCRGVGVRPCTVRSRCVGSCRLLAVGFSG
jgi:hypothetical protein